jgi:hypothetical protein
MFYIFNDMLILKSADPGGREVYSVGLYPLACWDCGFESHRGHGFLFLVIVVCCVGRGLYDGPISRSEDSEGLHDHKTSNMRRSGPLGMSNYENKFFETHVFLPYIFQGSGFNFLGLIYF